LHQRGPRPKAARPSAAKRACLLHRYPGEEVKNGKTLHYKLSEPTISISDTYLGRYWPLLLKGTAYTAPFVSRHGGQKRPCRRRAGHRHGSGVAPRSGRRPGTGLLDRMAPRQWLVPSAARRGMANLCHRHKYGTRGRDLVVRIGCPSAAQYRYSSRRSGSAPL